LAIWDKFKNNSCLGIEFGGREVKAMVITKAKGGLMVTGTAIEPIPAGIMENGKIVKGDVLAGTLAKVVEKTGSKQRQVVTAIPGEHVITRYLKLPQMRDNEVAQTLKWEAEKYIPISEADLVIEHINFGPDGTGGNQLNILLVAVPKKVIYQYYEIFSLAGLELLAIDIEPLALWRLLFLQNADSEPVGLVDIGAASTEIAIANGRRLEFSRSFGIGINNLVNSLASSLMVDAASAEETLWDKVRVPLNTDEPGSQSNLDFTVLEEMNRVVHEIKRSLDFYGVQSKGKTVRRIFLSGELAALSGLEEFLRQELEVTVMLLKPVLSWLDADMPGQKEGLLHPAWAVTAGLAMREVAASGTD